MKEHILSLSMRARIKRETVEFGRYTVIGKYSYRYIPETGEIERALTKYAEYEQPTPFGDCTETWVCIDFI